MNDGPVVVAVINTNPDIVRMWRISLEKAGFVVFEFHIEDIKLGAANVDTLLTQHGPKVIVYDVAPPYDMNWRFLDHLRTATGFKDRRFVLTSVNPRRVLDIIGTTEETVFEVVGEADDVAEVVRAVKEASRARATR